MDHVHSGNSSVHGSFSSVVVMQGSGQLVVQGSGARCESGESMGENMVGRKKKQEIEDEE